jgi:hypothetical protein
MVSIHPRMLNKRSTLNGLLVSVVLAIPVRISRELGEQQYTDINTMGAQACSGGACEVAV